MSDIYPIKWGLGIFYIIMCGYVLQDVIYPSFVKIVEVGPRDGLQNEKVLLLVFKFKFCS